MQRAQRIDLVGALASLFRPRPAQTVVEWCESQYELSTLASGTAGRFSTGLTPYTREIIDSVADFNIETTTLCFGAQTAKSQTFMAAAGWALVHEPCPVMWVMPNKDLARSFSETRLQPFLFSSPEIGEIRLPGRNAIKKTEMMFSGALFTLVGSNSPANLASRPVRILFLDEVDKYPLKTAREADALALAIERTRSFYEPKIFKSSTPTTVDGQIWQEFLSGDMRRYFVPCPHCEREVLLVLNPEKTAFEKLLGCEAKLCWAPEAKHSDTWDYEAVERSAHFLCPHCRKPIHEKHKTRMNRLGVWRPTNPDYSDPRARSYHLPTFYAPWKNAGWGRLAVEFLKAKHSVGGLQNFLNSVCAEPDMGQFEGGQTARRELITLTYDSQNRPKHAIRIMTVDVQKDHFWYLVREWYPGGHSTLVKWGKAGTFEDLKVAEEENKAHYTGLDDGYTAAEVWRQCARFGWYAMRGEDRETWPHTGKNKKRVERPFNLRKFDAFIGTSPQKGERPRRMITELQWSNPTIKDILHNMRQSDKSPVRWAIPSEYATEEYFRHLNGEVKRRVANLKTGKVRQMWVLRNERWPNHLFDCECMNTAFAICLKILKTQDEEPEK